MRFIRWSTLAILAAVAVGAATAQSPAVANPLFASSTVLRLRLTAPLQMLFGARKTPDQEVQGSLAYTDESTGRETVLNNVAVSLRGNTSLQDAECSFPKLKLHFTPDAALDASPFRSMKTLKIGTHCGERAVTERTPKGRVANDVSPHREAFAYRVLDALGVTTLKARPAEITYVDGDRTTTHKAMLLEDMSDAIRRLGADREIPKEQFGTAKDTFALHEAVKLAFGEAAVGNFDWCVKWTADDTYRCDARQILWNVAALGRAQGGALPLMYDLDISGVVTGSHGWFRRVLNESFIPSRSRTEIEVISQVQRTRSLFSRAELDAARRDFAGRKDAAYQALDHAPLDADGKTIARAYLDGFFRAIETDAVFYRPVVTAQNVMMYTDGSRSRPACDRAAAVGTAIGDPQTVDGDMVQAPVLDVLWQWSMNQKCDATRAGAVWLPKNAISSNYPPN